MAPTSAAGNTPTPLSPWYLTQTLANMVKQKFSDRLAPSKVLLKYKDEVCAGALYLGYSGE